MLRIFLFSIHLICVCSLYPVELYRKNRVEAQLIHEKQLIDHVEKSFEKTMKQQSKLNNTSFKNDKITLESGIIIPFHHLLNNLCSLENASHLHVGLYTGGSFVSALYQNEELLTEKIGIDIFSDVKEHIQICDNAFKHYLKKDDYKIIIADCFAVDIYLYDADHSTEAHERAFTYYDDVFSDVFIAIIDDWGWEQVRKGTFSAFDKLQYHILYENVIPGGKTNGTGQYVAIIKRDKSSNTLKNVQKRVL